MADLTTLAKARQQIFGNDPAIEADVILTQLITSSSAWIEREVGGDLMQAAVTEYFDGDGGTSVRLQRCHWWRPGAPAASAISVTVDGLSIPARAAVSSTDTNPSGYIYREGRIDLVGFTFTPGTKNVTVAYTAGYATSPADLEQACLEHVAMRFRDRQSTGQAAASGGGDSVTYSNAGTLAFIQGVLETYRVMVFA